MSETADIESEEHIPGGTSARGLLESVQHLAGVGVWVHDLPEETTWWSREARRIHGFEADENPPLDAVVATYADGDRERVQERLSTARNGGEGFAVDVTVSGEGTRSRLIRLSCAPQTVEGAIGRLHGTVQEVTELRRREQRIEVLRDAGEQLRGANTREEVAAVIAEASKNILGLVNTAVRLIDDCGDTLETVAVTEECVERAGERPDYPVDGNSPAARVYRTGEPELYPDVEQTDDWDRGELVSGIYVPIGEHGVLSAGDIVHDAFDEEDLDAASLLGELGAEALTRIGWARRSRAV